jgi:hypothetical protein
MSDVTRVLRIREDKPALQNLLQRGSIGDELWNSLLAAEKELETEILEVIAEANSFVEGWGTVIFQTANEMIANEKIRSLFEGIQEARSQMGTYDALVMVPTLISEGLHSTRTHKYQSSSGTSYRRITRTNALVVTRTSTPHSPKCTSGGSTKWSCTTSTNCFWQWSFCERQ